MGKSTQCRKRIDCLRPDDLFATQQATQFAGTGQRTLWIEDSSYDDGALMRALQHFRYDFVDLMISQFQSIVSYLGTQGQVLFQLCAELLRPDATLYRDSPSADTVSACIQLVLGLKAASRRRVSGRRSV